MNEEFVQSVIGIAAAYRKRSLRQLGMSPLVEYIPALIQKHLSQPINECSPVIIGVSLVNVINQAIESMKPEENEGDTPARRIFTYLHEYLAKGKDRQNVEELMSVSRSLFYEIQQEALESLAARIWELEQKEEENMSREILHNLVRPPYTKFVERYNSQGRNYIEDVIIPELRDGRSWIVALTGDPGIGKSSLAYATAERVVQSYKKPRLPFEAVIIISIRHGDLKPGKESLESLSNMASMASVYDVIGSTLGNRGVYKSTLEEKKKIVDELMRDRVCLFVFDNLDSEWILDESFKRDLEDFVQSLPPPHKALVTFRADQFWRGQCTIKIEKMSLEEAKDFLSEEADLRGQKTFSENELNEVYQKTYGVPLAMRWTLGLVRMWNYQLEEALDFKAHGKEMLRYMYEKAYQRLPLPAKKLLFAITCCINLAFPEVLEYISGVSGPELTEHLGRLYRGHLIESTEVKERQEYGYSLVPFAREYLEQIKSSNEAFLDNLTVEDFLKQAHDRMPDYYIQRLNACEDRKESGLLLLKYEKHNIINSMVWCWERADTRFVCILKLIGPYLGTLHYLLERENWGRRAVELLINLQRFEEANWHLIYDVGWTLTRKGTIKDRDEGRTIFERALEEARRNNWSKNIALALVNLSRMMISDRNLKKAQEYLEECKPLILDIEEDSIVNLYHRSMADLMRNLMDFDGAIKIYQNLNKIYIMKGDINGQTETLSLLALTLAQDGDCKKALQSADEGVKLGEQIPPPAYSHAFSLRMRAEVKNLCQQYNEAISDAEKAMEIYKNLGVTYQENQLREMINELKLKKRATETK